MYKINNLYNTKIQALYSSFLLDMQTKKTTCILIRMLFPIGNRCLDLGIWQGIYLCEFRNHGGSRRIIATIIGE